DAQAEGWRSVMVLLGRDHPEEVLHQHKSQAGGNDRPHRNHALIVVHGDGLWIAHGQSSPRGAILKLKLSLTLIWMDGEGTAEVASRRPSAGFSGVNSECRTYLRRHPAINAAARSAGHAMQTHKLVWVAISP